MKFKVRKMSIALCTNTVHYIHVRYMPNGKFSCKQMSSVMKISSLHLSA